MPLPPLAATLTDGQKVEAMKRFRALYGDELTAIEAKLADALLAGQEADFLAQYLGEQPELKELRARAGEADKLEKRRQYLAALVERLDQYTPKQPEVKVQLGAPGKPPGLKRF
jgi:hypothetical protein